MGHATVSVAWGVFVATRSLSRFSVLASVLLCVVLVQILPQVDLPDSAFHRGSAPLVARSRFVLDTPLMARVRIASRSDAVVPSSESEREQSLVHTVTLVRFLPTLLCSLLC
jgi:hypothetical protein